MPRKPPRHSPLPSLGCRRHQLPSRDRQASRALPTNSTTWRALRASILAAEPLCRACGEAGQVTAATVVDHHDGDSWNNAPENLVPMCASCHSRKTASQDRGFGNPRRGRG